jgi:hypothetical protein
VGIIVGTNCDWSEEEEGTGVGDKSVEEGSEEADAAILLLSDGGGVEE